MTGLAVRIAGRVLPAVRCGGCRYLVPVVVAWRLPDGRPAHMTCTPQDAPAVPWTREEETSAAD